MTCHHLVKIYEPNMNTLDNIASGTFFCLVKEDWDWEAVAQVGLSETMTLIFMFEMVSTLLLVEHLS